MPNEFQIKRYTQYGHINPVSERVEGQRPPLQATAAPYLPLVRGQQYDNDYFVVSSGKAVAFDTNGYLVPAGLALDVAAVELGGAGTILYTQTEVDNMVVKPSGDGYVSVGDSVAELMVDAGIGVQPCIGVASVSYYRCATDLYKPLRTKNRRFDILLPQNLRRLNYKRQTTGSIVRSYVLRYPVVAAYDPPWGGIAVFSTASGNPMPGDFVTFDMNSNIAIQTTPATQQRIGQLLKWDADFPKGYLDYVRTAYGRNTGGGAGSEFDELDKMPGSATEGLPDRIIYAGGSAALGDCEVHIQIV